MNQSENGLPLIAHCPHCAAAYQPKDAHRLETSGKRTLFYLLCQACNRALLLAVVHRRDGMNCTGIFTDCSLKDAERFLAGEKVSVDDVLSVHTALKLDKFLQIR